MVIHRDCECTGYVYREEDSSYRHSGSGTVSLFGALAESLSRGLTDRRRPVVGSGGD